MPPLSLGLHTKYKRVRAMRLFVHMTVPCACGRKSYTASLHSGSLNFASNQIHAVAGTQLSDLLTPRCHQPTPMQNANSSCSGNPHAYAASCCLTMHSNSICSVIIHIIFIRIVKSFHSLFDVLRRLFSVSEHSRNHLHQVSPSHQD